MRFLRLKPRRVVVARTGANEEEEEEGRQGLLTFACKHEQSSDHNLIDLYKNNIAAADQTPQHPGLSPVPLTVPLNCNLEQPAACTSQIVVLNAAVHCQGCARRVKKTLSKLQGVNTYHVDMEQQKVTVIGNVCPDNVLLSVNKVIKGARLWGVPNKLPASP